MGILEHSFTENYPYLCIFMHNYVQNLCEYCLFFLYDLSYTKTVSIFPDENVSIIVSLSNIYIYIYIIYIIYI